MTGTTSVAFTELNQCARTFCLPELNVLVFGVVLVIVIFLWAGLVEFLVAILVGEFGGEFVRFGGFLTPAIYSVRLRKPPFGHAKVAALQTQVQTQAGLLERRVRFQFLVHLKLSH